MSRVEVFVSGRLPDGLNVGDEFPISGTALVVGVEDELVDASGLGASHGSLWLPGERTVKLLLRLDGAAS